MRAESFIDSLDDDFRRLEIGSIVAKIPSGGVVGW